jgi:restriction system protein
MSDVLTRQIIVTAARFGQLLVPIALLAGAAVSGVRQFKGGRLLAAVASDDRVLGSPAPGQEVSAMTWREFEILVHEVYRRRGYRVAETPAGADGGIDLVLGRDGERYFVQCKHWQAKTVGVKVVRELKGVVAQAAASGGGVVTSGRFTSDAVAFASKADIDLVDGRDLASLASELHFERPSRGERSSVSDDPGAATVEEEPACPSCGSAMVLRQAKRGRNAGGRFWGCSRFPTCRGTRTETSTSY